MESSFLEIVVSAFHCHLIYVSGTLEILVKMTIHSGNKKPVELSLYGFRRQELNSPIRSRYSN